MNQSAKLVVFSTLAVRAPFDNGVLAQCPQQQTLHIEWSPTTVIASKLAQGQHADVVIATDEAINAMVGQGQVTRENCFPLATAYFGVAVPHGHPRPDITTQASFFNALTAARSVAYSLGGASGIYLQKLLAQHNLLALVEPKATKILQGFTGEKLLTGEADLAVQQMSELMTVAGIDIVGPFPDEVQQDTPFTLAIMNNCGDQETAQHFVQYLLSASCRDAWDSNGLKCR